MSLFATHYDIISYLRVPCQPYFGTLQEMWLVTESYLRLFFCLTCVICSDSYNTTLFGLMQFIYVFCYDGMLHLLWHPWEENHKRLHCVTLLRKHVCKSEVGPSAWNPTDSVCGVSLCMILDYGCNNPRRPLGNMLIAQIGNFFSSPHSGTEENKPTLSAFQTLIIGFGYWIWYPAPLARIPNLEFLEAGWFSQGHEYINEGRTSLV